MLKLILFCVGFLISAYLISFIISYIVIHGWMFFTERKLVKHFKNIDLSKYDTIKNNDTTLDDALTKAITNNNLQKY